MKVEVGLVSFKSKLSKPCSKLFHLFKFPMKKPFSIKSLWPRRPRRSSRAISKPRTTWSWLRWLRRVGKMERMRELRSDESVHSDNESREKLLFPSPMLRGRKVAGSSWEEVEEVEDACRSFENYLMEMIIEEGKVRDLMDVEELLYCWRNLKCPVFVDLVCRFYGELCKDLFSSHNQAFTPNFQPKHSIKGGLGICRQTKILVRMERERTAATDVRVPAMEERKRVDVEMLLKRRLNMWIAKT